MHIEKDLYYETPVPAMYRNLPYVQVITNWRILQYPGAKMQSRRIP
jgi:hypothetical protein